MTFFATMHLKVSCPKRWTTKRVSQPKMSSAMPGAGSKNRGKALQEYRHERDLLTMRSLLLRTLISPESAKVMQAVEYDQRLYSLGNLCFTQLAELRHRGAFSTVAQTFALVCRQCALSRDAASRSQVSKWYKVTKLKVFRS